MSLGTDPSNDDGGEVNTTPPQPTVMVAGTVRRPVRSVAFGLLEERASAGDGAVVVTTCQPPPTLARRASDGAAGFDRDRLAVVDLRDAEAACADVGRLVDLAPGADPGTVDAAVGDGLAWLDGANVDRRHFLYDTLAGSSGPSDPDAAYDRAYQLAMTVGAEDGLALFALDTTGFSPDVVERLTHLFDVHVELREGSGDVELRWTGLLGSSDGWVRLAEVDLGVGGFE